MSAPRLLTALPCPTCGHVESDPPSETKEWIPVGERLPPPNPLNDSNSVRVLMYSPDTSRPEYRTEVGCLWYAQNVWMADRARHVTHWMPIPKEPK